MRSAQVRTAAPSLLAALVVGTLPPGGFAQEPPGQRAPAVTWDFETGDLRGWSRSGPAFSVQPARDGASRSTGYQGAFRVATDAHLFSVGASSGAAIERLRRLAIQENIRVAPLQQATPVPVDSLGVGSMASTSFVIGPGVLRFLVGGSDAPGTRVALEIVNPSDDVGRPPVLTARGPGSDAMREVEWDLRRWEGQTGRIWVVDESPDPREYIAVDDFRFEPFGDALPPDSTEAGRAVPMPRLFGMTRDEASRHLERVGLRLARVETRPSSERAGTVVDQAPDPDVPLRPGAPVAVVLAIPMPTPHPGVEVVAVPVPPVTGLGRARARTDIEGAGLQYAVGSTRWSMRRSGTVLGQSPQPFDSVAPGTTVTVTVARHVPVVPIGGGLLLLAALPFAFARVRRTPGRPGQPEGPKDTRPVPSRPDVRALVGTVHARVDPTGPPAWLSTELRLRLVRDAARVTPRGSLTITSEERRHG